MSSTMNRDEGTPVDKEVVADAVGTELTVVPRREQDKINIHKFERDMAAAGKVTAEDRELIAIIKRSDTNNDGEISLPEAFTGLRDAAKVRSLLARLYPNPILTLTLTLNSGTHRLILSTTTPPS